MIPHLLIDCLNFSYPSRIVTVDMITQPGMVVSNLHNDGNGRYHVEVSWIPTADKLGNVEQLCYQAVDAEK